MRPFYRVCRLLCQAFFLSVCRGRAFGVRNVPTRGGVLLVCNHQSFFDPVLATLALPRECAYMARDSLFRTRVFRALIEALNAFPIKRGTADLGAIRETLRRLKAGALITAFPEGTRTQDGSIGPLLPGIILVARRANVPIVPAVILGAYEAWPRGRRFPRLGRIRVAYGRPIDPQGLRGQSDEACVALVRAQIVALKERFDVHENQKAGGARPTNP